MACGGNDPRIIGGVHVMRKFSFGPGGNPIWALGPTVMLAFAGNSLLARAALADPANSAAAFVAVRLATGAMMLTALSLAGDFPILPRFRDLPTVISLFIYAAGFALAYASMDAASGALILFASVQTTIVAIGLSRGDRIGPIQATGYAVALSGVCWLLFPGLTAPKPLPAVLMTCAGIAWGLYSTINIGYGDPVARTTRNFIGATVLSLSALLLLPFELTQLGWCLAALSGVVTSALGYVLWYMLLPKISSFSAASFQLSVPAITGLGAAGLLDEPISMRLAVSTVLIICGIALTLRR